MATDRNDRLAIALAGCGSAGMHHGEEIVAGGDWRLAAVCDVQEDLAAAAAKELGVERVYTGFDKMVQEEELDAVAIITPAHVHVRQIEAAAAMKVHCLCEKPLGITVDECERAVSACKDAGVLLGVTYTYRFVPDFRILREWVDRGEIGDVREVRWLKYGGRPADPRPDPPPELPDHHQLAKIMHLFDCGVHAFDLMRWFAGDPVVAVSGSATAPGPGWEPTDVTLVFTYAGGQRGVFDMGAMTAVPGCDNGQPSISFLVIGTEGSIAWDYRGGWRKRQTRTSITAHTAAGSREKEIPAYDKCRDVQYAEFARGVRTGSLPPHWPTGAQAVEATKNGLDAVAAVRGNTVHVCDYV